MGERAHSAAHHLYEDTADDDHAKDVGAHMRQLVVACKGQLERHAEALPVSLARTYLPVRTHLDSHDADAADQTADAEVHKGRLRAVSGNDAVNHVCREDADKRDVAQEREAGGVVENLVDGLYFFI